MSGTARRSAVPAAGEDGVGTPEHVAVIMDGNGRWAQQRGLPRVEGHRRGVAAVRAVVEEAIGHGVRYLTLYAFSTENWERPADEVSVLMSLLLRHIRVETDAFAEREVRIRFIGDRSRLEPRVIGAMEEAERRTAANARLDLVVGLNYGGRHDLVAGARQLVREAHEEGLRPDAVDEARLGARLMTAGIPDPDLVIRTGGERRLSNFLLWQVAYAELHFASVLWPDFRGRHFQAAIEDFRRRRRRYGALDG